jgi:hypothetical protein
MTKPGERLLPAVQYLSAVDFLMALANRPPEQEMTGVPMASGFGPAYPAPAPDAVSELSSRSFS